jgi:hypothetical protein
LRALSSACLLAALIAAIHGTAVAQSLSARTDGDRVRIVVSGTRFLSGDALKKLHDGVPVSYVFRLTALTSRFGTTIARSEYRFVISYDIFEEKFQVSRVRPTARVVSHLSVAAAESALIEAMDLPIQSITAMPFWLRLEYQAEESSENGNPDVSLGGLVEIFSRTSAKEPIRGMLERGPLRLSDLPRTAPARGATSP